MHLASRNASRRGRRRFTLIAILAVAVAAVDGTSGAAPTTPPPWVQCAYADHPAAADLGPLLPATVTPPAAVLDVLHGRVDVGTDCSIYEPLI
jgi:hypothetical protein